MTDYLTFYHRPTEHDQLWGTKRSDATGFEPFDRQHVLDKYPHGESSVLDRLGLAISQRRAMLRYRERHRIKLETGLARALEDKPDAVSSNVSDAVATEFIEQNPAQDEFDFQSFDSQTSYEQTPQNGEQGMVLPPPPTESEDGAPFECPYCFVIITISDNKAWAVHVFKDLMPYICVFSDCPTPHRLYESRREWFFHLQSQHSIPKDFGGSFTCPLCSSSFAMGRSFERHVARHLEELAIFALRFQPDGSPSLSMKDAIKRASSSEGSYTTEASLPQVHQGINEQVPVDLESADETDSDTQDILSREEEQANGSPFNVPIDENALYPAVLIPRKSVKVWFDMPFTIWCETCDPNGLIAEGSGFLAERQPLDEPDEFTFLIQHEKCSGWIELHSGPRAYGPKLGYEIVKGGRRAWPPNMVGENAISQEDLAKLPDGPERIRILAKARARVKFTDPIGNMSLLRPERCYTWPV